MSYASVQAIRESAGLLSRVNNETPKGLINGTNPIFTVVRRPIVDGDYDDDVTVNDIRAFVNGAVVPVTSLDPVAGTVTLTTAPIVGAKVTVDYQFSPITDEYVAGKQQEADSWINLKLKGYVATPLNPVPGIISTVAEMYAAGLILTRDWGNRVDTEQTSKDGFSKLKTARELLADYIAGIVNEKKTTNASSDVTGVSVITDVDPFTRTGYNNGTNEEDFFMRREY